MLEKAPFELRGGNTRFAGGMFRFIHPRGIEDLIPIVRGNDDPSTVTVDPYPPEAYEADIKRVTGGRADPVLTRVMIDRSLDTLLWMAEVGVPFEFSRAVGAVTKPGSTTVHLAFGAGIRAIHEGVGLSASLFEIAEKNAVEIHYASQAGKILTDDDGKVTGIEVRGPNGLQHFTCGALVLASGGFQASEEMRTAYLGKEWGLVKVRGTRFNTGEMTRAAVAVGAQTYGHWGGCHATPIDADAPPYGDLELTDKTNRLSYTFGVMLNCDGNRFVDEGEDGNLYTYAKFGAEILKQRNAVVFQVFDQQTVPLLERRYNTGKPVEAGTLEDLVKGIASRYGALTFNTAQALRTLEAYNQACSDEKTFDPDKKDGKRTNGLALEKSNWATRLDRPPFRAYSATTGITFTFGGVRIDTDARVLDAIDRPIPGLFATGEITGGFYYGNYPAGSGLMRGAIFGRIAERRAPRRTRRDSGSRSAEMLLSDAAYTRVRDSILGGGIAPGSVIRETTLTGELKMSRTPIREALRRLQAEGLIVPVSQGGYVLVEFDARALIDVYTVQSALEALAAKLAAANRKRGDVGTIADILDAMEAPVRRGDDDELTRLNGEFHDAIAIAAGNEYLRASLRNIREIVVRHRPHAAASREFREQAHTEHRAMLEAISERDAERAEEIARRHVEGGLAERLESFVAEGELTGRPDRK